MTDDIEVELIEETPTRIASNVVILAKDYQYEYGANGMIGTEDGYNFYKINVICKHVTSHVVMLGYDFITAAVDSALGANIGNNKKLAQVN